jgi:hypothetical protein
LTIISVSLSWFMMFPTLLKLAITYSLIIKPRVLYDDVKPRVIYDDVKPRILYDDGKPRVLYNDSKLSPLWESFETFLIHCQHQFFALMVPTLSCVGSHRDSGLNDLCYCAIRHFESSWPRNLSLICRTNCPWTILLGFDDLSNILSGFYEFVTESKVRFNAFRISKWYTQFISNNLSALLWVRISHFT